MIIISYLLSLSLLIFSVVKTAEIFIQSDKKLQKIQKDFISHTLKDLRGSISLIGAVFVCIISSLLLLFVTKMNIEYREALYRKNSYLCLHFLNNKTESYFKKMVRYNVSLRAAYIAILASPDKASAQLLFNTIKGLRNSEHLWYLKSLSMNNYCTKQEVLSYLHHLPFKVSADLTLTTLVDQTSVLREKKWSTVIMKSPIGIRLKKSFCLKSTFTAKNAFLSELDIKNQEIGNEEQVKLKCLSG